MPAERSAKRRKLDTAPEDTLEVRVTPRQIKGSSRSKATSAATTPQNANVNAPNTSDLEEQEGDASRRSKTESRRETPPRTEGTPMLEEIVVRASGRTRKVPAKLKEDTPPVKETPKARTKSRTPMSIKHNSEQLEAVHDKPRRKVTKKKSILEEPGKENVIPSRRKSDSPSHLAVLQAQQALELHDSAMPDADNTDQQNMNALRLPTLSMSALSFEPTQQEPTDLITHDSDGCWTPQALSGIQQTLMARLTGSASIRPVALEDEYLKVHELINQAVETGESNSMILIGSRGSGKTTLVNHVLRAQRERYPDEFHIIRLNGFIHTDDKLALRDIWRQLGKDMGPEIDDDTIHSYADTLTMLLALLSDPTELGQSQKTGHMAKSVIFVLDEFDLFATHPRQTLLYNLFDIAQSRKAPIAVLGLTTRVDIVEALEKRVKSRFSHRYVHLGLAKSLSIFSQICTSFLELTAESSMASAWAEVVNALQASNAFHQHLSKIYYRTKSVSDFLSTMLLPLASLTVDRALSTAEVVEHFVSDLSTSILGPDSKLDLLPSLSSLQLALLICGARQSAIYNTDNVTFNLIYEEYKNLAGKAKLQATASGGMSAGGRVLGKDVAKNAWHDLIEIGLVMEDGRGIGKVDIALEEIAGSGVDLGQWSRWCKEI